MPSDSNAISNPKTTKSEFDSKFDSSDSIAIGVLSGKGGVGKTTLVANLGASLASQFNKKVLIVDSNVKTSHIGLHLGLYEELPVTVREVLLKKVPVMHAIFFHPATGVRLLPAPLKGDVDLKDLDSILKELKTAYEIILVDCAPGLGRDVVIAAKAIDKALLVTTPDLPAVTDVLKTIELLKKFKKDVIGIVLNRVKNEKHELTVEEIESTCGYDVLSVIPETNKIPESIAAGVPLVMNSNCQAVVEFKALAASLIGAEYEPDGLWYRLKQFFSIIKKPKSVFVREEEKAKGTGRAEEVERKLGRKKLRSGKERLIKEKVIEERAAIEERTAIEELKEDLKDAYVADLEKEILKKVKEKLRDRMK